MSRPKPGKYLYMQVTKDKYEIPIHVAESTAELAEMCGKSVDSVRSMISRGNKGWVKVEMEEEEDD